MKKNVLITGATSGIGLEFARAYHGMGYRLILSGRNEEKLKTVAEEFGEDVCLVTADLEQEEGAYALIEALKGETVDVFINNAGFGAFGKFTETSLEKELALVKINDISMHILFKHFVKEMTQRGEGTILNVASSAGLLPAGPFMATYYASKAYVVSLTRGVAEELKEQKSKVLVSALCPGPVDTGFNARADVEFSLKGISSRQCVKEALKGLKKRKTIIVPSATMRMATTFQKFVPTPLLLKMIARQQKKKGSKA